MITRGRVWLVLGPGVCENCYRERESTYLVQVVQPFQTDMRMCAVCIGALGIRGSMDR